MNYNEEYCILWYKCTDILQDLCAFIFRAQEIKATLYQITWCHILGIPHKRMPFRTSSLI